MFKPRIGVIGGAKCTSQVAKVAEDIGRGIAQRGGVLICGGLGGVMEAACRGAKSAGGFTVGILPGSSAKRANPYVDLPIVTNLGEGRNIIVVRSSQVLIALQGGFGTLSEISFALKLGLPVVGLSTWEISPLIHVVQTSQEAIDLAFNLSQEIL
jgi:uncharacterized protein (TIGR00725 family)